MGDQDQDQEPGEDEAVAALDASAAVDPEEQRRQDYVAIATSSTYNAGDPSYLKAFYDRVGQVGKKFTIEGYDHQLDAFARRMMISEFLDLIAMVAPLSADNDEQMQGVRRYLRDLATRAIYAEDPQAVITLLRGELTYWVSRTRFGLPPKTPTGAIGYEADVVFQKLASKIASEHARRIVTR